MEREKPSEIRERHHVIISQTGTTHIQTVFQNRSSCMTGEKREFNLSYTVVKYVMLGGGFKKCRYFNFIFRHSGSMSAPSAASVESFYHSRHQLESGCLYFVLTAVCPSFHSMYLYDKTGKLVGHIMQAK